MVKNVHSWRIRHESYVDFKKFSFWKKKLKGFITGVLSFLYAKVVCTVFFIPTFFVSEEFYHWNSICRQVPPPLQWKVPPNCRTSSPLGCCPLLHLHHPRWHVPWQFYGHLMDKRSSAVEALSWQLTLVSYYSIKLEGLFHIQLRIKCDMIRFNISLFCNSSQPLNYKKNKFSMKDENKIIKKQCYVMYFSLLVVYLYICLKCSSVLPIDSL